MDFDDLAVSLKAVFTVVAAIAFLAWGAIAIDYAIQNVPIKATVDGKIVYDGVSACAEVESSGYATKLTIHGGWYCLFPQQIYVGKNIVVEGKK